MIISSSPRQVDRQPRLAGCSVGRLTGSHASLSCLTVLFGERVGRQSRPAWLLVRQVGRQSRPAGLLSGRVGRQSRLAGFLDRWAHQLVGRLWGGFCPRGCSADGSVDSPVPAGLLGRWARRLVGRLWGGRDGNRASSTLIYSSRIHTRETKLNQYPYT
jgi:hypothetical protein